MAVIILAVQMGLALATDAMGGNMRVLHTLMLQLPEAVGHNHTIVAVVLVALIAVQQLITTIIHAQNVEVSDINKVSMNVIIVFIQKYQTLIIVVGGLSPGKTKHERPIQGSIPQPFNLVISPQPTADPDDLPF